MTASVMPYMVGTMLAMGPQINQSNVNEPEPVAVEQVVVESTELPSEDKADCVGDTSCEEIERLKIIGRKITPISITNEGVYTLDQQMLKDYNFANGNLNDVLGILPGVQYGETAYSADQVSNIKPDEVSISGAEGFESGYQIDGVGNNSQLSTGNARTDRNLMQDVSGHSQASFVNVKVLDNLKVFDSNIPAKYGRFSGGLVLAETQTAQQDMRYGFSYRETADSMVDYHEFYAPDFDGDDILEQANFSKQDFSAYLSTPIGERSGILVQLQALKSTETMNQLGRLREQKQTNYNGILKFHHDFGVNDRLVLRYFNAPYTGDYFDVSAIDSDYQIKGGGQSLLTKWSASRRWGEFDTQFDWRHSENSKDTQSVWYVWDNLPGKNWGQYNNATSSVAGGFGDIEKRQDNFSFSQDIELSNLPSQFSHHQLSFGYQIDSQKTQFDRLEDSIIYNGAVFSPDVDCAGYTTDCIETLFFRPISEIEQQLGRPLDLTNSDDFLIYQANVKQSGQYFQTRQLSPQASAVADIVYFSVYAEDQFEWRDWYFSLGLRYDFNDFFRNHNLAPRLSARYQLFTDHQLLFGASRYYQADLANFKLNEAIQPVINQVRRVNNNRPQQWQSALVSRGYRYIYKDTRTPFSDELTLAYRLPVWVGTMEFKLVERSNKDTINRIKDYNQQGEAVIYGGNSGGSEYRRLSLAWMVQLDNQHVEFNISHASNTTSAKNFDGTTTDKNSGFNFSYDDAELVYLREDVRNDKAELESKFSLITRHDLSLERQDANRPIVANLSWAGHWGGWKLSAHARFNGSQDAVYPTNQMRSVSRSDAVCDACLPNEHQYPVYRLAKRPSFWLLNGSIKYQWSINDRDIITLSFEGQNLLNQRTYQVSPFTTGLELGRRFWLGISYDH